MSGIAPSLKRPSDSDDIDSRYAPQPRTEPEPNGREGVVCYSNFMSDQEWCQYLSDARNFL